MRTLLWRSALNAERTSLGAAHRVSGDRAHAGGDRLFLGACSIAFAVSAATTVAWCGSMSARGGTPMPGGWMLSMMWTRMPNQSWIGAAADFVAMWIVMMFAMMLPSLVPTLFRYRALTRATPGAGVGWPTACMVLGYFGVWAALGAALFPLGAALAGAELRAPVVARAVPHVTGVIVLLAGVLQLTPWKAHHLDGWRGTNARSGACAARVDAAWRAGLRLGLHCVCCCIGATAVLLALGVGDLRVMTGVTAVVTAERMAPPGARVARAVGVIVVLIGVAIIASTCIARVVIA